MSPCAQHSVLVIKFVSYVHVEQFSGNAGILHLLQQRRKRHPQKKVDSILSAPLHCCVEVLSPLEARGTWLSQLGQIQSVHSIMNTTHRRRSIIVQQLNLELAKGRPALNLSCSCGQKLQRSILLLPPGQKGPKWQKRPNADKGWR